MKKVVILGIFFLVVFLAVSPSVFADNCTKLSGKTICMTFVYSNGNSNSYTTTFNAGNFTLGGSNTGTYSCPGRGFVEINYSYGGFEDHTWYGRAASLGTRYNGFGKSTTNGYLYSAKGSLGACAAAPETAVEGAAQNE